MGASIFITGGAYFLLNIADIHEMDIAIGLKELLISHGFTLDALLETTPAELAAILGIDLYVAKLIRLAAYRLLEKDRGRTKVLENVLLLQQQQPYISAREC
jgi:hypothetical protein